MSVKASSWAWESSRSTGSAFLVLLALADHAGADDGDCWPSVDRLAKRCRIDARTVQRSIDKLVELGEVIIVTEGGRPNPGGRGRSNRYRLTFTTGAETMADRHPSERVASAPETPASAPAKGGATPPEPSVGTVMEPTTPPSPPRLATPASWVERVEPDGPVAIRREASAIFDAVDAAEPERLTPAERRKLRQPVEDALGAGYASEELVAAIRSAAFRTEAGVMGELRKRRQAKPGPTSVGNRGLDAVGRFLADERPA